MRTLRDLTSVRKARLLRCGRWFVLLWLFLALGLVACGGQTSLAEPAVADLAWQALEPNTHSHDRANWEFSDVRQVRGGEVATQFEGNPAPGCMGPEPPPNNEIGASRTYWYVLVKSRPVTPPPEQPTLSPTDPPHIPEPFLYQALFLLDITSGQVVARKLHCVIY